MNVGLDGYDAIGDRPATRRFIDRALHTYPEQRNVPATTGTSRLSPHLHFGEIGPRLKATIACTRTRRPTRRSLRDGAPSR